MFPVSVIHSEVTRRFTSTVYMVKTRGVPVVVFVLLKNILQNRSYVNIALNSRGRRMSEITKLAIVQYLLMYLSVEAIQLKHFRILWSADKYLCITLSNSGDLAKDSEEQETTAYLCVHQFSYNQHYMASYS